MKRYYDYDFEKNGLDVLRYMIARLKQNGGLRASNAKLNQLRDRLEFLFLTEELHRQPQLDRFAFKKNCELHKSHSDLSSIDY